MRMTLENEIEIKNKIRDIFFEAFPNLSEEGFSWNKEQKDYDGWVRIDYGYQELQSVAFTVSGQ